mmetsp:Transcript_89668/g.249056  ORF Transcript_89668/g.249056 Transcript_89668/m.249056 type:complete len:203 (+) Transcript_89668:426-1034(+)
MVDVVVVAVAVVAVTVVDRIVAEVVVTGLVVIVAVVAVAVVVVILVVVALGVVRRAAMATQDGSVAAVAAVVVVVAVATAAEGNHARHLVGIWSFGIMVVVPVLHGAAPEGTGPPLAMDSPVMSSQLCASSVFTGAQKRNSGGANPPLSRHFMPCQRAPPSRRKHCTSQSWHVQRWRWMPPLSMQRPSRVRTRQPAVSTCQR